jgi:uncharacterized integral membrane protein
MPDLLTVLAWVGAIALAVGLLVMAVVGLVILGALVDVMVFERRRERRMR